MGEAKYKRAIIKTLGITTLSVGVLSLIIPILMACFYVVPAGDDFVIAANYEYFHDKVFFYPIWYMLHAYMVHYGGLVYYAFVSFPTFHLFGVSALRIQTFINACLFFLSVSFFIYQMLQCLELLKKREIKLYWLGFSFLFLLYLLGRNYLSEAFLWWTGYIQYTGLFSIGLLSASMYLKHTFDGKQINILLGCIFALLSSGGNLMVSALLCSILLLFVLYEVIIRRKVTCRILIFISLFGGSIINALAPGNMARKKIAIGEDRLLITESIVNTFRRVGLELDYEIRFGIIMEVLFIAFFVSLYLTKNSRFEFKYPIAITFYSVFAIIITDFPVLFGQESIIFEDRIEFVEHFAYILYGMIWVVYISGWINQRTNLSSAKLFSIALIIVPLCLMVTIIDGISVYTELTPYKMARHLVAGDYRRAVDDRREMIDTVMKSDESSIIWKSDYYSGINWTNLYLGNLSDDPMYWQNQELSSYYGKEGISIVYNMEDWIETLYAYYHRDMPYESSEYVEHIVNMNDSIIYEDITNMISQEVRSDDLFAEVCYRQILGRNNKVLNEGRGDIIAWGNYLKTGGNRIELVRTIMTSDEFMNAYSYK